jgi:nitroimidazol reductase NimA-like FMN-containing flavoprotein (pyridoxamine 5'-phosphate oxidase superfamily)
MQERTIRKRLDHAKVEALLLRANVGRLSTNGADGYPYTIALHFAYEPGHVYLHCAPKGEKTDNLLADPRVCFEVDEVFNITNHPNRACGSRTTYESVVIFGRGQVLADEARRYHALGLIGAKYAPQHAGKPMDPQHVSPACVIDITIEKMTGKGNT